ncbi:MAG: ATP-binding protein [Salinivirgaceae bacterium]|jgi:predicted AAA+ superfamily ATPase|nr:ATP-binding protein [Bacteroidales bacterium]
MITRILSKEIDKRLFDGKAIIIQGARQVGKTSLLYSKFDGNPDVLWLEGDNLETQLLFENFSLPFAKTLIGNKKILIIDEAQNILNIGIKLKIIIDQMKDIQVIATGSSSFDLANKINEPLTGRKWEYKLYPISFAEMVAYHGVFQEYSMLEQRLVYGYYPEVVMQKAENMVEVLQGLATSYLYKDVLKWENIQKSDRMVKLLQALAFQVGSQVSYTELGRICGLDAKTIEKYILLLEQAYIIFRLNSFSRNQRNELKFSKKIYFYDNGIRNALIANFNPVNLRNDVGALWENFLISERQKKNHYSRSYANSWFWRTQTQKEIDYLEEKDGVIYAFEIKWSKNKKTSVPSDFIKSYPNAIYTTITPENFYEFIGMEQL